LKVNYSGCAICDSTWGNLWAEVEGTRLFFCCDVCLAQFRNLIVRVKAETGWSTVETLSISGDRRGRLCHFTRGTQSYACQVAFNAEGSIRSFHAESTPGAG
jgi:Ta0938